MLKKLCISATTFLGQILEPEKKEELYEMEKFPIHVRVAMQEDAKMIEERLRMLDRSYIKLSELNDIRNDISQGLYLVGEFEGVVTATLKFRIKRKSLEVISIVSVKPGGATAFVSYLKEYCRDHNIKKIWGYAPASNTDNKIKFEKLGCDEVHLMERQFYGEHFYFYGMRL